MTENNFDVIKNAKRIVIKVGTSTLTYANGNLNFRQMERLTKVLSDIKNSGREIIFVTSGAIGVGAGRLGLSERPRDTQGKQAAAAVGQCQLMYFYDRYFEEFGHTTAQLLLTRDAIENDERKANIINTLDRLLEYNAIPIINENDTVSIDEIEFGDNDTLSAIIAVLADADALILLTDIDGLYTGDPRKDKNAQFIDAVSEINEDIRNQAGGAGTSRGTGGMNTKIHAAEIATAANIPTVIMDGSNPNRIYNLLDGEPVGTYFAQGAGSCSILHRIGDDE